MSPLDDTKFTGRAGLSYLFDFGLAPYVATSTSFVPQQGTNSAGRAIQAAGGEGQEIGIKHQAPGTNLMVTAAIFDVKQKNLLTADPNNINFNIQIGEVQVEGLRVRNSRQPLRATSRSSAATSTSIPRSPRSTAATSATTWSTSRSTMPRCGACTPSSMVRCGPRRRRRRALRRRQLRDALNTVHPELHVRRRGAELRLRLPCGRR